MTTAEIVQRFNPLQAAQLSEEDLAYMRTKLTDADLDALAGAYPNDPYGKPYLLLYDVNLADKKQLYQPSTWQNLRNIRKFANQKQFMPWTFKALHRPAQKAPALRQPGRPAPGQVVDLSATDAAALLKGAGSPKAAAQVAKETKPAAVKNPAPPAAKAAQVVDVSKATKPAAKGGTKPAKPAKAEPADKDAPADQQEQVFE